MENHSGVDNRWWETADLAFVEAYPGELSQYDRAKRRLRRHFLQGSFSHGGRMYGPAFWANLPKTLRRERLRISGEPAVTADYSSMFVSLLYAKVQAKMPTTGGYSIPGLEAYEKGTRRLIQASLFKAGPVRRAPQNTRELLPPMPVVELMARIKDHHHPIARYFGTTVGYRLMFQESNILLEVLRRLRAKGILGLPLHDAVIVPASAGGIAKTVMQAVFYELTRGGSCDVRVT